MRRVLACLITGVLALTMAGTVGVVGAGTAQAAPTYATVDGIDFAPAQTQFNDASSTLTAVVTVDVPGDWAFVSGDLQLTLSGTRMPDWLQPVSQERIGQVHKITFRGQVPNDYAGLNRGYLRADPVIYYRDTTGGLRNATYSYPWYHALVGDVRASIDGPSRIATGSALRLTGRVTCFRSSSYVPPPTGGWVSIEYRVPGESTWTQVGGESLNLDTGTWAHTVLSVGTTLDWRAVAYGNGDCADQATSVLRIESGAGDPPPAPTLPGAPGLQVGAVGRTTVALNWTAASGTGITGYRFGWETDSGLPQPAWSQTYTLAQLRDEHPFVMTNLNPGSTYTMWIEALTSNGAGDRSTVTVTTDATPTPPPGPVVHQPTAVRSVTARPAGSRRAIVRWVAPVRGPVDRYQVHRTGRNYTASSARRALVVGGLVNGRVYRFVVRAHNPAGWGAWSRSAAVRPHR